MIIYLYYVDIYESVSSRDWLLLAKISRVLSFGASVLLRKKKWKKNKARQT